MSYAVLFAGQGQQHPNMLPWLPTDTTQSAALTAMAQWGVPPSPGGSWRQSLADAAQRRNNRLAQPLITGTSLAIWELLQPLLPAAPAVVAGYSVGELAACACAGVWPVAVALRLAALRADCMDRAAAHQAGGLMSVSGMPVEQILRQHPPLHCAIVLAVDHAIVGGCAPDLEAARQALAAAGAACKVLDIDVASHTPLMASAAREFATILDTVTLQAPHFPLVLNADASLSRRASVVKLALGSQICTTVDWAACMQTVAEQGIRCVLEIGPGNALSTLWNRHWPAIPARAVEDFQSPQGTATWVARFLD